MPSGLNIFSKESDLAPKFELFFGEVRDIDLFHLSSMGIRHFGDEELMEDIR